MKKANPSGRACGRVSKTVPLSWPSAGVTDTAPSPDGELVINPDEAAVVRWIFDRYLNGDSLGKIVTGLEEQSTPSPTGKPKWNCEAISKLLSKEKYTGRGLLQKTINAGSSKFKNDGFTPRYLYNVFRNRWCGAYFSSKGICVVPTVSWGDENTFDFCFDGIPRGSTVAVSTYMVSARGNHADQKEFFLKGYREMLRRIELERIICYNEPFPETEGMNGERSWRAVGNRKISR